MPVSLKQCKITHDKGKIQKNKDRKGPLARGIKRSTLVLRRVRPHPGKKQKLEDQRDENNKKIQQLRHKPAADARNSKLQLHLLRRVNIKLLCQPLLVSHKIVLPKTRHDKQPVD